MWREGEGKRASTSAVKFRGKEPQKEVGESTIPPPCGAMRPSFMNISAPDRENRFLYLIDANNKPGLIIHGTNSPKTIGHLVASGCIRLVNDDVEDLYRRVSLETRVVFVS